MIKITFLRSVGIFIFIFVFLLNTKSFSETVKEISIIGNERIPVETIKLFSKIEINEIVDRNKLNEILKNLYETNFFSYIEAKVKNNVLEIIVKENPIIYNIKFEGLKSKSLIKTLTTVIELKERTPFNKNLLDEDRQKIQSQLREMGYFFSIIDIYKDDLTDNRVDLIIKVDLGEKSKISKISFIGDKKYKNKKLSNIIISEEYKFWKFLSGKKYLNQQIINLDKRLLKNFYLNKGYYNIKINSSFAKLIDNNEFELIFNINAGPKISFGELKLNLPSDYNKNNFTKITNEFNNLEGSYYSIKKIENILKQIDKIVLNEQYESVNAVVDEILLDDKLNLTFKIFEEEKIFIERINIIGNNVTSENVIRNQLEIDEGDPFNKILETKSINNIKSLNFFRSVESKVSNSSDGNSKIINIKVEEKPTGEIMAGAGFGTSGSSILFGVKENNFLGNGVGLDANINLATDSIKGKFSVNNPNYKNSDKSLNFTLLATETNRLTNSGYKTNQTGASLGTRFEYYDDFFFKLGGSLFYEKLETDSTASARQKTQEGDYFDGFLYFNFDYDKRDQKFQTSDGFRSNYGVDVPLISESYTLTNSFNYKYFSELYEDNITSISFSFKSANSINNENVKLSERLYLSPSKLRGFEFGKVGPKEGDDFVGGNFISSLNLNSTLPQILSNNENTDFLIFMDIANIWGVDYDSSLDDDKIRSSIGIGIDWFTPVGPLTFSLAQPLSKSNNDKTESFRFNLGTTF